jgi:hypothetical protein
LAGPASGVPANVAATVPANVADDPVPGVMPAEFDSSTVPVAFWMLPSLLDSFTTIAAFHAILGLQAYALLLFALSGIVRIFQVKRQHDLYQDPDPAMDVGELHENMDAWRGRLRLGVFGYVLLWLLAYVAGVYLYLIEYIL